MLFSDLGTILNLIPLAITRVEAAPVLIDSSIATADASSLNTSPTTVFISDTVGYTFFVNSNGFCSYASTTDKGVSWSSEVTVDSINTNDCIRIAIWYDQWTPGDNSGTYIHIATIDTNTDDTYYTRFNTATNTLDPTVVATTQSATFAVGTNYHSITKGTDNILYIAANDASDSWVVSCSATCTTGSNWGEITNPYDLQNDWPLLVPLLNGSIMTIRMDLSANVYSSRIWNGTSWSGSWTTILSTSGENSTYDAHFGATVDRRNGDVYFIAVTDNATLGTDDDVRVAHYSQQTGLWTGMTDVLTNTSLGLTDAKIAIDENSNDIYAIYSGRTTATDSSTGHVYYKVSINGMSSWGSQNQISVTSEDIYGGANSSIMGRDRLYTTWRRGVANDLYGEVLADVFPPEVTQAAFRWYENADSTIPGNPLAGNNTATTSPQQGVPFRLRMLLDVASSSAASSSLNYKLQYAIRSGTCDVNFTGETYVDVASGSGNIRFYDNGSPTNGISTAVIANEPSHSGHSINYQTYVEVNPFSNVNGKIYTGTDGLWDFSLVDASAPQLTTYCFRVVATDGSPLYSYSVIPEITTPAQVPIVTQTAFHWRNDDGSETTATSKTSGVENTNILGVQPTTTIRLRLGIDNRGSSSSASVQYRIEYAQRGSSCSTATGWVDVGAAGGHWDMSNSTNINDGDNTTDILASAGGVTNLESSFLSANGGVRDVNSQTGGIVLGIDEYTELEYSISARGEAIEGETYCFRVTNAGSPIDSYLQYPQASIAAPIRVTTSGSQVAEVDTGTTNQYVGGVFAIQDNIGAHTVTSITIAEQGTVDAQTSINNIKLFYESDVTAPYDCVEESYSGGESQYGLTDNDGFSSANGTSTFTGSVGISTTSALCVYVVLDVLSGAQNGETLEIEISNASTDVSVSGSPTISPSSFVRISGTTLINSAVLTQYHYHWRNDDGAENAASSATGGVEDIPLSGQRKNVPIRLRVGVSNEGGTTSALTSFRLEYGIKTASCAAVTLWNDVGATNDDWNMSNSTFITDGDDTTDIAPGIGGISNEATTITTPNGGLKTTSSETSAIIINEDAFIELEYSIVPTASSTAEEEYCFRVTDAGTPFPVYNNYPEVSIAANQDFFVQRGFEQITGTSTTIYAGVDYIAPATSSYAFIRITNTHYTGAGDSSAGGTQNADDVTVYIENPENLLTSVTFRRPDAAINDTHVAWEIVEYQGQPGANNEIKVHFQGTLQIVGASLFATSSVISGVNDPNDVVVFITGAASPDTGTADYNMIQSIASWNATNSVAVFERGEGQDTVDISFAVVEFTGAHWRVQRILHTYSSAGATENESIPVQINSTSRAFIHTQKLSGTGQQGLDEFGHTVWIADTNTVSFELESGVTTPSSHQSVAWIIENVQLNGTPMNVIRSDNTQSGGSEPSTVNENINGTIARMDNSSLFITSRVGGTNTAFPRPIMAAYIISTTQYRLWISDTGGTRTFRTEVVEWPTAPRKLTQNYYRFYVNNDALLPTDVWPEGASGLGENTSISLNDQPIDEGQVFRMRMSILVEFGNLPGEYQSFKLQFGQRDTSCSAITNWLDVGAVGSTTALWRGYNNPSVTDGSILSTNPPAGGALTLSVSDRAGTYEESNNSAVNPHPVSSGEDVEYDWVVERNGALDLTPYCFRIVEANNNALDQYNYYPTVFTSGYKPVSDTWRWYDDAENETPSSPLSSENSAPTGIGYDNTFMLRIVLSEIAGKIGPNLKLRLQYDESSNFTNPQFVTNESSCIEGISLWCYADGGGVDNATITTALLVSSADSCVAETGNGCGTHNEFGTTSSSFTHQAGANTEFAFTLRHVGARANTVYFFRVYDVTNDRYVAASSTKTYPSLVTEGAGLTFTISGVPVSTVTEGVTTDNGTTANSVTFGTLPFNSEVEVAQRLSVTTNATEGYQIFMYSRQGLLYDGNEIDPITEINASPQGWATGCDTLSVTGCFGYHTGDDTLSGGSARFSANDTYARVSTTTPEEIVYSSGPVTNEITDIVFKTWVTVDQPGGLYESSLVYIVVPVF